MVSVPGMSAFGDTKKGCWGFSAVWAKTPYIKIPAIIIVAKPENVIDVRQSASSYLLTAEQLL